MKTLAVSYTYIFISLVYQFVLFQLQKWAKSKFIHSEGQENDAKDAKEKPQSDLSPGEEFRIFVLHVPSTIG